MSRHFNGSRTLGRITAVAALTVAGGVALALPASAHVTVSSASAAKGGYATVVFKVPTESDTASTVKLVVTVPSTTPLASVSYQPLAGWSTVVAKAPLATPIEIHGSPVTESVSTITWTADKGAGIAPGQFQTFPISTGPLPDADSIPFQATQTYSDGKVVNWDQIAVAGAEEPEHPAPTLKLTAAAAEDHHADADAAAEPASSSSSATTWAIVALVVAVIALIIALVAVLAARKKPAV